MILILEKQFVKEYLLGTEEVKNSVYVVYYTY